MLWLQVSVDNQVLVQVLERADNLGRVKRHVVSDSELVAADSTQQVAPTDKVHLDVDVLLIVEGRVGTDDIWAIVAIFA